MKIVRYATMEKCSECEAGRAHLVVYVSEGIPKTTLLKLKQWMSKPKVGK